MKNNIRVKKQTVRGDKLHLRGEALRRKTSEVRAARRLRDTRARHVCVTTARREASRAASSPAACARARASLRPRAPTRKKHPSLDRV